MAARRVKLLNVRLRPEDEAMAAQLRAQGIGMSELVRDAIRTAYGRRRRRLRAQDVDALLAGIYEKFPDPARGHREKPASRSRRAVRDAVERRVRAETER